MEHGTILFHGQGSAYAHSLKHATASVLGSSNFFYFAVISDARKNSRSNSPTDDKATVTFMIDLQFSTMDVNLLLNRAKEEIDRFLGQDLICMQPISAWRAEYWPYWPDASVHLSN
jgi:hypothetical protein